MPLELEATRIIDQVTIEQMFTVTAPGAWGTGLSIDE